MAEYDLVIRNTTIATASDVVKGDIGIVGGRVVALGERLDKGRREIGDALGQLDRIEDLGRTLLDRQAGDRLALRKKLEQEGAVAPT